MEISNRAIGIVAAVAVTIGVCIHSESSSYAAEQISVAANSQAMHTSPIPDSDFSQITPIASPVVITQNLGTPNSRLIGQNQSGVVNPAPKTQVPAPQSGQPSAKAQAPSAAAPQAPIAPCDYSNWANSNSFDSNGNLSDQAIFDMSLHSISPQNQDIFRQAWSSMTPDEQQDFFQSAR